jgi:hypothetical protein
MPTLAIQQSKEARRIYLIAVEVRRVNPHRAERLIERVRRIVASVRVLIASREVR